MNDNYNTDRFSWQRCISIGHLYGRGIKKQLIIYSAIIVAFYLVSVLLISVGDGSDRGVGAYGVITSLIAMMLYITPVVFASRDTTLMAQLPVTPLEKFVFYSGYSLAVYIVLGFGLWYLICWLGGFIFSVGNINTFIQNFALSQINAENFEFGPIFFCISTASNILQAMLTLLTSLYVIFTSSRHLIVKCILVPVVYVIGVGLISGIVGVILGIKGAFNQVAESNTLNPDQFVSDLISSMFPVLIGITVFLLIATLIVGRMVYKRLQHPRIA